MVERSDSPDRRDGASAAVSPPRSVCAGRVFILGSCVSRDAFEHAPADLQIEGYVARTSLASAFHPLPAPAGARSGVARIQSSWQRRMVELDLRRGLPSLLARQEYDLILLDLIDERFRVGLLEGRPLTISNEFVSTGFRLPSLKMLPLGDERRMTLWKKGVDRLMGLVDPARIVLNRPYWATRTRVGSRLEDQDGIAANNRMLERLYLHLDNVYPFSTIDYDPGLLMAEPGHRWGVSPFHYVEDMYRRTMAELQACMERSNGNRARAAAEPPCGSHGGLPATDT